MKKLILKVPILGSIVIFAYRAKVAAGYLRRPLRAYITWLFASREITNFSFDVERRSKRHLASLLAVLFGLKYEEVLGYIDELDNDEALRDHIWTTTQQSKVRFRIDKDFRYGRRIGWYAVTRALKPKVVIETGIDKGLGACLLAAALIRNEQEGHPGRYYGTDINPEAGYLFKGKYAEQGEILYGDSIASLARFEGAVDLFINDSDHSAKYEAREYETIAPKLAENAVLLGDNAHCSDSLMDFALATGRSFVFYSEKPKDHWYPGGGIGICFRRPSAVGPSPAGSA